MEVTLIIHSVDGAREVPLTGSRLTLGRTEPADVVINDQSLSRVHASINRDGDRVWIIDEGSTNGSLVNPRWRRNLSRQYNRRRQLQSKC